MPLAIHSKLHAFERLRSNEQLPDIVSFEDASGIDLPSMHVGFLNMMPDAAIEATERQFLRLLHAGSSPYVVYVHPFTIHSFERSGKARDYVAQCYASFSEVRNLQLDALLLTGANPKEPDLQNEAFWEEFVKVAEWAHGSVSSVLCSCLASHAAIQHFHRVCRTRCVDGKRWGIFDHVLTGEDSPLVAGIAPQFRATHSHVYELTDAQLAGTGIRILATSDEAQFHIAVSADGLKWVYLQGHPEYDTISLLKEFKREIALLTSGERPDYPPFPKNYLPHAARTRLKRYQAQLESALESGATLPQFPESQIAPLVRDAADDHGRVLFANWIKAVVNAKACA